MTDTINVGGREIDLDDADAIRALSPDEFDELLTQTLTTGRDNPDRDDDAPTFPSSNPTPGTAILLPTSRPRLP